MFAVKTMLSFFFCKTATTYLGTSERTKQYRFSSEKECSPAAAFKKITAKEVVYQMRKTQNVREKIENNTMPNPK